MKLEEFGVGKITSQNTTIDVKPGETERQAKKLGLVNGKPKLLHKTAAKNSTPNKLFNLGLTEGYSKDMDEEWFKKNISAIAKKYKIDPKVALDVWRSEGGMSWQSKFKPKGNKVKTVGGQEASWGPFQLYTGKGGLGSAWEKEFGKKLSTSTSKADVLSQIEYALKTVPKRGWQDFKGANRVGIKQYQGVPNKNNPMYKNLPISKPTDVKKSNDMYNKVDKIPTQPSILDPRPLAKTIKKGATDLYKQGKKELGNIEVDKDSFTYKNIVKPAANAYDYISKGFTNWKKDLQNSPEFKKAGERNQKRWGTKPAQVKELKIQKPDPKDTLGKKRKDMPQIKKQDYEEFMDYLKSNGAKFTKETVPASELKAMQNEFSDKGIIKQLEKNIDQGVNSKAVIISDDDFVLDGHHRWIVAMNTGNDLDVYRVDIPAHKLFDLTNGFEKTYYKGMYETPGTINVPMASGLTISLFPHRPLKIKKPTKGKLNYNEDVNTQRGRLEYYLKQPNIKKGMAIHLGKLPKYHNGIDELARIVPERKGVYALHPDAWESTFYSLTNKDLKKITRYQPAIVKIPPGTVVGDMAIANQFYRTNDKDEKQKLAQAYQDSIVLYGEDISHMKMPEIIMLRLVESLEVNEAFNNPYPIDWGGSDDPESDRWVGNSKLADGSLLTLEIASFDPGEFQIDFYRKDKTNVDTMKATGQGDEFRVFATVQKGILEWWESIDQDEVSRIEFSASKESDDSKNRHKLYARFAKQWANKIGWVATTGQVDDAVHFVLMRPNAAKFAKDQDLEVMEDLRDWFKQKWVNIGKKKKGGGYADCGTSGDKKGYAKCVPAKKAASMSKKEKESAVRRKRSAQNKKGRGGKKKPGSGKKPIRVKTKKESMYESISYTKPKFDVEWEEANRYPYLEKLGQEGWEELANTGKVITLTTDSVKKIGNTGADGSESLDDLEPAKVARLKNAMTRGAIEMPIVVKQPDGSFDLVAGNTRLIGLISTQGEAKVWLIDASELSEEAPPGREKQVRKLKKKFDDPGAPYAIAWAQHNKHGKPKKESVNEDKVYDILLDNIGAGPFDGGCVVVAQALQKIHGGELMALVRNDGIADHAVVQVGETMYDYDGPGTVKEVVERFEKNEGARIDSVRKLRMTDLPDAPRSNELAKQIASEMKPVKEEKIKEGVNDPNIFKAVFMAGGPGSGKSFVAQNLLGGTGLRPVNSDEVYEFLLKRQGLTLGPDDIASDKGQEIRGTAKDLTDKRQTNYIDGRLGLIIDGTGKVPELIQKLASQLKSIGYSVSMIFVNTSLEVAQQRNLERERTLPKDIVANSWNEVQQNLMKYQQIFGADRFHIIDNSGGLEDLDRTKNFDKVYNEVQRFINTPPKHKKALEWIQNQKAQNNAKQTTDSGKSDGGVTSTN